MTSPARTLHDGASRNPHDTARMSGGSSGGSGSAVGGALVPIALGSDTNGSIRVPASFCGVFGLKPTYGRLSRAGSFPFVASLDHLGPLARSVERPRAGLRRHAGPGPRRSRLHGSTGRAGGRGARAGCGRPAHRRGGRLFPPRRVAAGAATRWTGSPPALDARATVELPEAARARAAAYVITATEGAALHLDRLRTRAARFRPGGARPADRRRAGAGAARGAGAEIPPLVPRRRAACCSSRSTSCSPRPRPARRR